MLIAMRNAMMAGKRLPYDAEVEYLESTGTQWIDTGIVPTVDDSFYCRVKQSIVKDQCLWGLTSVAYCFSNSGSGSGNGTYWGHPAIGQGGVYGVNPLGDTDWHEILCQPSGIFVDGVQINTQVTALAQSPLKTVALFARAVNSAGGGVAKNGQGRMSAFKVERNSVLVRDYIPVRKGTVGYLYDRVSKRLFGNAGTGDFVLGPDVVPVEYIESHGTEWIDTGLLGHDGYDFEYSFRPLNPLPCGIGGEYESDRSCYIGIVRSNGNLAYNYSNPNVIVEVQSLTLGTDYNIKAHLYSGEQYFEVNGVRGGVGSRTGVFTSSYNLYLFAINSDNQPAILGVMRLYNLTAHLNTIPTRSFRPVRVGSGSTWEGAMMDVLTRRIYRNAGTGAFTYGNDLKYPIPAE